MPTCYPACSTSVSEEQNKWDAILEEHDLSMDRGMKLGGDSVQYGQTYFDDTIPFDYVKPDTNARQHSANHQLATKLLVKMAAGMTQNEAAKALGVTSGNASRALKRYRATLQGAKQ